MRRTLVPPSGNRQAKLAVVAEQPGLQEIQASPPQPLIGPAGRGFDECLRLTRIPRHELYLTNVIKDLDAPLKHYINIDSKGKSTISPDGMQYIHDLSDELTELNPNCVLAIGNIALLALTNRIGITKWRGSVLESTIVPGLKVVPTFHPATFIPPKFNFLNKPLICEDLIKANYESEFKEIRRKERNIIIRPSFSHSIDVLNHCYEAGLRGQTISLDIEVINGEVDCLSLGWSVTEAISIPFRDQRGDYFTVDQELEIMLLVAKIIQEERIAKIGANFIFDLQFLFRKYGIYPRGTIHCTQIAQKISYPDLRAGLDAVTTMYTDIPYYKQEGKQWMKMQSGTWEEWWNYNGMDSIVPIEAFPKQLETLRKQGNIETYDRQRRLISPLIYMSERGIKVDVQGMLEYKEKQQRELTQLAEDLNREVGYEINYNSPPQMMKYFYDECGIKPYFNHKTHKMSSDIDALKRIVRQDRKGSQAARLMLDIRSLSKRISTYLNIGKIDKDGRMRSSYKPVGAETGRISSGETIFGTGCMPPDAEALTKGGWKSLYDLMNKSEEIIQWDSDGTLSWCMPIMNSYSYKGPMVNASSSIHQGMYTPDHRIPTISKRGFLTTYKASEVCSKSNWFLPLSGIYNGEIDFEGIELLAIIQADGSIEGNGVRFSFSKQRKIDRFIELMLKYNINYTEQSAPDEFRRFYIPTSYIKSHIDILNREGKKTFGSWLLFLSQKSLLTLLEEIKYWDAHVRGDSFIYYTINKTNAEWIATLAHLCGKSATIYETKNNKHEDSYGYGSDSTIYNVNIKPRHKAYQSSDMYSLQPYDGIVYAPTVETSYFLCRYKGTIFVTGNSNQQNWPHDLLRFFLFDEGYIGYTLDLAQIENRIVAYVGSVISQIEAFEQGIDLHKLTASIIFGKPYNEVLCEDGSSSLGDGRHSERYWGKKGNHALNYDVGYKTFALKNELPETEAKYIIEKIHQGYPQIRCVYHQTIQNMLKKDRTVTNLFGRKRMFLGPIIPSYPNVPTSACQTTYREAYAQLPQSTVADKVNEQGIELIYYNQHKFRPIELLAQVHDSIVFQIPLTVPWTEHAEMILEIKKSLETPLVWHETEFATPCGVAIGLNMGKQETTEIKSKDVPSNVGKFAELLRETYIKLERIKNEHVE